MSTPPPSNPCATWEKTAEDALGIGTPTERSAGKAILGFAGCAFLTGLGHALAHRRKRGLWWANLVAAPAIAALMFAQQPRYASWALVAIPVAIVIYIVQMLDGALAARKSNQHFVSAAPRRFALCLPLITGAMLWQHSLIRTLQERAYDICYSPTDSMAPAIDVGDLFVNLKNESFARWDIVGIDVPSGSGMPYSKLIKRVVGLPGETVEIRDDGLYVDGQHVTNPPGVTKYYAVNIWNEQLGKGDPQYAANGCWGRPIKLGEDEYFMLGDNSRDSGDSRFWLSIDGR